MHNEPDEIHPGLIVARHGAVTTLSECARFSRAGDRAKSGD
jgi:hypothetical protein